MNIVVDKLMFGWKWNDESLTIFFRPSDIERGERYIRQYSKKERFCLNSKMDGLQSSVDSL